MFKHHFLIGFTIPFFAKIQSPNAHDWMVIIITGVITAFVTTLVNQLFITHQRGNKFIIQEDINIATNPLDERIDKIEDEILGLKGIYKSLKEQADRIGDELRHNKELEGKLKDELGQIKVDVKVVMALIESLKEIITELKKR